MDTHPHRASKSPTEIISQWPVHLSHKPLYFPITHSRYPLHCQLHGASGCYHAPGNQRYSRMSQIGVNSYYSRKGVEGKWKLTYQKGHSCNIPVPSLALAFSICPAHAGYHLSLTGQRYLTRNTNVIPLPSTLCHYSSWFNGPVNCQCSYSPFLWTGCESVGVERTFRSSALLSYSSPAYYQIICGKLVWFIA